MKLTFSIERCLSESQIITLSGRNAWALKSMIEAGKRGCSPIDTPGPRWSAYVHNLRHEYHIDIQTINESHTGQFPGRHARYVLRSNVRLLEREFDDAKAQ
ncbi:winged helix domain-containing protein [Sneathiella aquimaris]|uniref:winged helix domain-containing protein n=1 Tax=Sneathiella aquimaris TaxID=2599305 RepID=UPI0031B56E58